MIRSKHLLASIKEAHELGFSYTAQDDNKYWWAFKEKPIFIDGTWVLPNGKSNLNGLMYIGKEYTTCNPASTLVEITDILSNQ